MEKKTRAVTESGVYLLIVAGALVAANVASFTFHKRIDTTKNQRFTLSRGSSDLVKGLKRPITVKAYVATGLAKLDAFVRDLDELMREYERNSGGKFVYQKIVPKTEEEKQAAKDFGLREISVGDVQEGGEDQMSIAQGYMGLVFLYGDEKDTIPVLSPDQTTGLEFWISNKIREIRDKADDNQRKIGLIGGHDEIKISDANLIAAEGGGRGGPSMRSVIEQAFPFYKFEDVDLKGGETEIEDSIDALVVTQPGKDFTDKELRRIDQFLMKGNKGVVVYASAINLKPSDAKFNATLSTHGLEKLTLGYGIEMKKDAVFDWARSIRIPVPTQTGQMSWIRAPGIIQAQPGGGLDEEHQMLDQAFPGFFRIDELSFPLASSLVIQKDKQPGATVKVVARSTPASWVDASETQEVGVKADWKPKQPLDQRSIAAYAEGKLKSAMGAGDGIDVPAEAKEGSRILVVSSAQFLANPFARQGNGQAMEGQMAMMMPAVGGDKMLQQISQPYAQKYLTATILSFKNTLDWLTGDQELVAASAKILGEPSLTYADVAKPKLDGTEDDAAIKRKDEEYKLKRKTVQNNIQWSLTLMLPLVFAFAGVAFWQLRERNRNAVRA